MKYYYKWMALPLGFTTHVILVFTHGFLPLITTHYIISGILHAFLFALYFFSIFWICDLIDKFAEEINDKVTNINLENTWIYNFLSKNPLNIFVPIAGGIFGFLFSCYTYNKYFSQFGVLFLCTHLIWGAGEWFIIFLFIKQVVFIFTLIIVVLYHINLKNNELNYQPFDSDKFGGFRFLYKFLFKGYFFTFIFLFQSVIGTYGSYSINTDENIRAEIVLDVVIFAVIVPLVITIIFLIFIYYIREILESEKNSLLRPIFERIHDIWEDKSAFFDNDRVNVVISQIKSIKSWPISVSSVAKILALVPGPLVTFFLQDLIPLLII